MIRLTQKTVQQILFTATPDKRAQAEDVLAPAVEQAVSPYVSDVSIAFALGQMFSWAALGGSHYLRDLPAEISESFGLSEDLSYTLCDMVLGSHADLFANFVENTEALRVPWKSKVKPELLKAAETKTTAAFPQAQNNSGSSSPQSGQSASSRVLRQEPRPLPHVPTPAPQAKPAPSLHSTSSPAPRPPLTPSKERARHASERDELARLSSRHSVRHQDALDRLNIRVHMVEQLCGVHFESPELAERFRHVIRPAIKGIKEAQEVERRLSLTVEKGGLGMDAVQVAQVLDIIERLHTKERELGHRAELLPKVSPPPRRQTLPAVHAHEKMIPMSVDDKPAPARQDTAGREKIDALIENKAAEQSALGAIVERKAAAVPNLPAPPKIVQDITETPRTTGPIAELRTMDLTDFRRLASQPAAAADKLHRHFVLLREEGVDRYAAGIRAWRESPLYAGYIQMLTQGLKDRMALEEFAAPGTGDPERFTKEEMNAIIELNRLLVF